MPRSRKRIQNTTLLSAALEGLQLQKNRIEQQIREVQALLGRRSGPAAAEASPAKTRRKRRPLSQAARKRISIAQKKRWADFRKKGKAEAK